MDDKSGDFSSLSDSELEISIDELGEAEANAEALLARALEAKNAPMSGVSGALKKTFRDARYNRTRIKYEETGKLLNEAIAEKTYRADMKKTLPALLAQLGEAEEDDRERNADAQAMQECVATMATIAIRMEKREERLRRLETSIENTDGEFRGAVRMGGTGFRPDDLARMLKTSMAMAFAQSKTYGRPFRVQGLHSPEERQRDFGTVIKTNGQRLLQKFRAKIDGIKNREVA
jgi:hypothetical protein